MASQVKTVTPASKAKKEKILSKEKILRKWVKARERLDELKTEEAGLKAKLAELERRNLWLGNIKGMIKPSVASATPQVLVRPAAVSSTAEPPSKRKRANRDAAREATPEQRNAWRLGRESINVVQQAMKAGKPYSPEHLERMQRGREIAGLEIPDALLPFLGAGVNAFGSMSTFSFEPGRQDGSWIPFGMKKTRGPPTLDVRGTTFESKDGAPIMDI